MQLNFEGLIPIIGGIYCFLLASGTIPIKKDAVKIELWRKQHGGKLKALACLVVLFGFVLLFRLL